MFRTEVLEKNEIYGMPNDVSSASLTVFLTIKQRLLRYAYISYVVYSVINNGLPNIHRDYQTINNGFPNTYRDYQTINNGLPNTHKDYQTINNGFPKACEDYRSFLLSIIIKQSFLPSEFMVYMFQIYN
jgi:hypothetical protein